MENKLIEVVNNLPVLELLKAIQKTEGVTQEEILNYLFENTKEEN